MKKIFNLILITILALSALKVQARTLSCDEVNFNISKQVVESYKKYTDAELKANVIALPFQNLPLPEGKVSFVVKSTVDKFTARDLKKVSVYVNEKFVKTFNAPVEVKAYKDVLVASGFIERDKMLTSSMVETKKMELSTNLDYVLDSKMLGKDIVTKKAFREGEIIDRRFVKLRPDVQKNANVKAYFNTNGLMIEVEAIALSDGMLGEYIGLENKSYQKVYTGKVIGENKVLIEI